MLKPKEILDPGSGEHGFPWPCVFNDLDLLRFFRTFHGQTRADAATKTEKRKLSISLLYINNMNILVIYTVIRTKSMARECNVYCIITHPDETSFDCMSVWARNKRNKRNKWISH